MFLSFSLVASINDMNVHKKIILIWNPDCILVPCRDGAKSELASQMYLNLKFPDFGCNVLWEVVGNCKWKAYSSYITAFGSGF